MRVRKSSIVPWVGVMSLLLIALHYMQLTGNTTHKTPQHRLFNKIAEHLISKQHREILSQTCSNTNKTEWTTGLERPTMPASDTLLIITFNFPHYDTIPYLEILYRPFFPQIVYCGPALLNDTDMHTDLYQRKIIFVKYPNKPRMNYHCMMQAAKMYNNEAGYLQISDDLLVNVQRFLAIPQNVSLFKYCNIANIDVALECDGEKCERDGGWQYYKWDKELHQDFYGYLQHEYLQNNSAVLHRCYKQLADFTGGTHRMVGSCGHSDMFYIPHRLREAYIEVASVVSTYNIFLEIAVPSMIVCIDDPPGSAINMDGLADLDYGGGRDRPWRHFQDQNFHRFYLHPTKWSNVMTNDTRWHEFYCNTAVPFLHGKQLK